MFYFEPHKFDKQTIKNIRKSLKRINNKSALTAIKRADLLRHGWKRSIGKNSFGHICTRHRSSGSKRLYRFVDLWRRVNLPGCIIKICHDPLRSSRLALVLYSNGLLSYVLASENLFSGEFVFSGDNELKAKNFFKNSSLRIQHLENSNFQFKKNSQISNDFLIPREGDSLPLKLFLSGSQVFNFELYPFKGSQICRAAGTFAIILKKNLTNNTIILKLRSGWKIIVSGNCMATLGVASNLNNRFRDLKKAGFNRNKGFRPSVRGVAMNPVDHPHGGGEGKSSPGPKLFTPWGKLTKNVKTVSKKKRFSKKMIRFKGEIPYKIISSNKLI